MKISTSLTNRKAEWTGVITLLCLWKAGSLISGNLLFPAPEETLVQTYALLSESHFLIIVGHTLLRGLAGFTLSAVTGIGMGYCAGRFAFFEGMNRPALNFVKATPVMSIIILMLIWFDTNTIPVVVSFLVSYPMVYSNVMQGTKAVDWKWIEMASVYNVSHIRIFLHIYIPAIMPYLLASLNTAMGIGWKAVIASEVLLQPRKSIGEQLMNAKSELDFVKVFAWTLVAIVLSYFFDKVFRTLESRLIRWQ